jgi:hypothetical protein
VDSAFVQAMREGWVVMIDEVNTIRDVALLSINSCLSPRSISMTARMRSAVLTGRGSLLVPPLRSSTSAGQRIVCTWRSRL